MQSKILAASVAATVALAVPSTAAADPHTSCASSIVKTRYTRLYHKTARVHGRRQPGRNIRRYGMTSGRKSRCADLRKSSRTFLRWLAPSPVPVVAPVATSAPTPVVPASPAAAVATPTSAAPASSGGGYAIPSDIVRCESGGNYGAVNPSSGAYGAYQILPSTAAAHGCDLSTSGGQDACAGKIMATEGRGAWSC
jgi:hypothetical protein